MGEEGEKDTPRATATMVGLIQDQLEAQLEEANSNFGNTLTLIGIDATLIGVAIAGAGQLGSNYWIVLIGLLATVVLLLLAIRTSGMSLGPRALSFYEAFGEVEDRDFESELLVELDAAFAANARALQIQQARILRALVLMVLIMGYAVVLALSSGHGEEQARAGSGHHHPPRGEGSPQGGQGADTRWIRCSDHQSDSWDGRTRRGCACPGSRHGRRRSLREAWSYRQRCMIHRCKTRSRSEGDGRALARPERNGRK
jgi:hypothetical protein